MSNMNEENEPNTSKVHDIIGQRFVFLFSQAHPQFRRAEFESVCCICGVQPVPEFNPPESHFQVLDFDGKAPAAIEAVHRILGRSVLLKGAYQVLLEANSHAELVEQIKVRSQLFQQFDDPSQSWCFQTRPQWRKHDFNKIQEKNRQYAALLVLAKAPIDLENAQNKFTLFEVYDPNSPDAEEPKRLLLTRFLGEGQIHLKNHFALTDRCYIGNSTMDPELAFIQANLSKAGPNTLAFDPFCGTGGLLLPAAHFGAHVLGVEIKWDVARAKGKSSRAGEIWLDQQQSVRANFAQYGLDNGRFLGILLADSSQHAMWRIVGNNAGLFDAILTDPPYGIREKGQKLGANGWKYKQEKCQQKDTSEIIPTEQPCKGFPEKQRYQMSSVFLDLLDLAARLLRVGGRLAFWFPVCRSEYSESILPRSECMRHVHNCEQPLTKDSARRLLVFEKQRHPHSDPDGRLEEREKAYFERNCYENATFRQKIFGEMTRK